MTTINLPTAKGTSLVKAILLAFLIAGTLDIAAAFINYMAQGGKKPEIILKFIASGVFDRDAFKGGWDMMAWGLFFHYLIAFLFTLFYFMIYPFLKLQKVHPVVSGLVYGVFVWLIMNQVVLRLSHVPSQPFDIKQAVIGMLILMFCLGLPISLIANKYYLYKK